MVSLSYIRWLLPMVPMFPESLVPKTIDHGNEGFICIYFRKTHSVCFNQVTPDIECFVLFIVIMMVMLEPQDCTHWRSTLRQNYTPVLKFHFKVT